MSLTWAFTGGAPEPHNELAGQTMIILYPRGGLGTPFSGRYPDASGTHPMASDQARRQAGSPRVCIRYPSDCIPSSSTVSSTGAPPSKTAGPGSQPVSDAQAQVPLPGRTNPHPTRRAAVYARTAAGL
jgi:hypothetical protein